MTVIEVILGFVIAAGMIVTQDIIRIVLPDHTEKKK